MRRRSSSSRQLPVVVPLRVRAASPAGADRNSFDRAGNVDGFGPVETDDFL